MKLSPFHASIPKWAIASSFFLDEKRSKKIKAVEKKTKNLLPVLKRNELARKIKNVEMRDGLKQHFFS